MNLVDLVTSQLTGDVLGKLAGLTGTNEAQTRSATSAAVPALLSAFGKMASTNSGASTLANSLGGLDLKTLGNLAGLLGGSQASGLGSIGGSRCRRCSATTWAASWARLLRLRACSPAS